MQNQIKAVIFDMDGTLVDTELVTPPLERIMLENLEVPYTEEFQKEIIGLSKSDLYNLIKRKYNPNFSVEEADQGYLGIAKTVYQERASLMPGAKELISFLKEKQIPMAIASAAPKEWIEMFINRFDLEDTFLHLLSAETLKLPSKPDPAIFRRAMQLLEVQSQEVVIFEDTLRGIQAGKAAGARVIAVPDERWSFGDFSSADLIADTLKDPMIFPFLFP